MKKQKKWGNVRVLTSLISEIRKSIDNDSQFANVSDFVQYVIRQKISHQKGKIK